MRMLALESLDIIGGTNWFSHGLAYHLGNSLTWVSLRPNRGVVVERVALCSETEQAA